VPLLRLPFAFCMYNDWWLSYVFVLFYESMCYNWHFLFAGSNSLHITWMYFSQ
jgi:hypothetical protein